MPRLTTSQRLCIVHVLTLESFLHFFKNKMWDNPKITRIITKNHFMISKNMFKPTRPKLLCGQLSSHFLYMLHAILKHVPSWNLFQIGMACYSKKCAVLIHISDWHCSTNVDISRADNKIYLSHCIWSRSTFTTGKTNKQTNKCSFPGLLVSWTNL